MPEYYIPLEPEKVYHVYTHANGNENLFREEENYHYFLKKYVDYIYPVAETFAYCLMPNHLHLMIRVRSEKDLQDLQGFQNLEGLVSQKFSNLFNAYTKAYNVMFSRKGSLFIPRFKRKLITSQAYFTRLIVYIHSNPVHHHFVSDINEWSHSSWHAYLLDKPTKINRTEGVEWFGDLHEFIKIHEELRAKDIMLDFET